MRISLLTIGDEILIGQVVDTNSAWMGKQLSHLGARIIEIASISDNYNAIQESITRLSANCDYLLITGGLGPTKDDITKKAIAELLGMDMVFHQETYDRIVELFKKFNRTLSDSHLHQCYMPTGADILINKMGTAPGMRFAHQACTIVAMPGVPYEMQAIMQDHVLPEVNRRLSEDDKKYSRTIMTAGEGETYIEDKITDIVDSFPQKVGIAYLPSLGHVRLRITGQGATVRSSVDQFTREIAERLGKLVYGYDDMTLEESLKQICNLKKVMVGAAESCTGGYLSHRITSIAGSSSYFKGSIVSYANELKVNMLGVQESKLIEHGAVSEETVKAMAQGALKQLSVDIAVAISGIAGPDGGTKEKPVGTIWICVASNDQYKTIKVNASKDRLKNIEYASNVALNMMYRFVENM